MNRVAARRGRVLPQSPGLRPGSDPTRGRAVASAGPARVPGRARAGRASSTLCELCVYTAGGQSPRVLKILNMRLI